MAKTDIVVVGVGGQGSLMASQILGEAAVKDGLNVMSSEVHGMAQRGGVVSSTVRIGDVFSPLVSDADADILLGFEPLETLRSLGKSSPSKTLIITNTRPQPPFVVSIGKAKYPNLEELYAVLEKGSKRLIKVDMEKLAKDAGLPVVSANIILVGVLLGTGAVKISKQKMLEAISENVPKKFLQENYKALDVGIEFGRKHI